ncbi:MAG: SDR family oxidoreductase [Deltaproteobacteria bacterium]|nr:SDR family oxidoreductase [Deltaproteobacteria bacterium]
MGKSIMITGASSGIGKALAFEMASRGYSLGLVARNGNALGTIRGEIDSRHPDCKTAALTLDVTDYASVPAVVEEVAVALDGLDIVFVNAGIAGSGKVGTGGFTEARRMIETNVIGAIATIEASVACFLEQGSGHVVGVSSVAAFRGLPGTAAYCASKAGLAVYLEALRAEVHRKNIDVTVLYPGYIDTPLNNMLKSRPFLIPVEKGAAIIARMIEKKVKSSTVPKMPWSLLSPMLRMLPTRTIAKMG